MADTTDRLVSKTAVFAAIVGMVLVVFLVSRLDVTRRSDAWTIVGVTGQWVGSAIAGIALLGIYVEVRRRTEELEAAATDRMAVMRAVRFDVSEAMWLPKHSVVGPLTTAAVWPERSQHFRVTGSIENRSLEDLRACRVVLVFGNGDQPPIAELRTALPSTHYLGMSPERAKDAWAGALRHGVVPMELPRSWLVHSYDYINAGEIIQRVSSGIVEVSRSADRPAAFFTWIDRYDQRWCLRSGETEPFLVTTLERSTLDSASSTAIPRPDLSALLVWQDESDALAALVEGDGVG